MPIRYELKADKPQQGEPRRSGFALWLFIAIVVIIVLVVWGLWSRHAHEKKLTEQTNQAATLVVTVIHPQLQSAANEIILPGNVHAWHEASLVARTNGYLKAWHKDIGDHVKAGDLLAEIDTPEIDAQLRQSEADLALSVANNALAQTTAQRWLALLKTDSVTKQETDEKVADAAAKAAAVQSSAANRDRLVQMEEFKRIVAPFDGVVTNRTTDIGALISENGGELYHIAGTDKLRIYVNVPENYTALLTPMITAELHFAEHPGKIFYAHLLDTAKAIDPGTRTLLVQFAIDNPNGALFPGGYCEVHVKVPSQETTMRLPANAFLFRAEGLQAALVGPDNKVTLKPVQAGRDFGGTIEVLAGVSPQDNVIVSPADSLYQGETVRIGPPPKPDGGRQQQQATDGHANDKKDNVDKNDGGGDKEGKDHKSKSSDKDKSNP